MSGVFVDTIRGVNSGRPPVWFMRQAGRYHSHYQAIRARHSFMDLCKVPELACEVTMGPIQDFDFDAAILFSDLLFPLEAMGMGLKYDEGPKLDWHLREPAQLERLRGGGALASHMDFQAEAMRRIRARLSPEKGLIGFVGGPLTLFYYAAAGSHQGDLSVARSGLDDGRFEGFVERLADLLAENMALQARAGADVMAMLDTCGGELTADEFGRYAIPTTRLILERFKKLCPDTPVLYYSKGTGPAHWRWLAEGQGLPIAAMGVDWRHPLHEVLRDWTPNFVVQGNVDPQWLFLTAAELESRLREVFAQVQKLPRQVLSRWICGLGHGVLPKTPESNVRLFLRIQKEMFQ